MPIGPVDSNRDIAKPPRVEDSERGLRSRRELAAQRNGSGRVPGKRPIERLRPREVEQDKPAARSQRAIELNRTLRDRDSDETRGGQTPQPVNPARGSINLTA